MYICPLPLCHSGTGKNKTGAFSVRGNKWHCFSCGEKGDIFDLYGKINAVTDYNEQFKGLCRLYGIDAKRPPDKRIEPLTPISKTITEKQEPDIQPKTDYEGFFLQANKDIEKTTYHRGISIQTLNRFKVGYVEKWKHPKTPNAPETPRLIIPTSRYSYLARDTRDAEEIPEAQKNYTKIKVGKMQIYNLQALQEAQKPIFVVEGEIDTLSIIDVGGEAVGLGSLSNIGKFLEIVRDTQPKQPFIIALDNENNANVQKKTEELKEGLKRLGIQYYSYNPYGRYKDANEALQADRTAFQQAIERAAQMQDKQDKINDTDKNEYKKQAVSNYISEFVDGIKESVNTPYICTGFPEFDKVLGGGLYEGLYVLGAISSLGKTTFALQIADNIAQTGQDVIIFSLEMARYELMAKSISRETILHKNSNISIAKTARQITTGVFYDDYSAEEKELIKKATQTYASYAEHIYIHEGVGDIGTRQIRDAVKKHIQCTNTHPVVIVDYIQILAPADTHATDKQNIDKTVLELKRISRDYKIPVIGISSFNRANYHGAVTMEAFKESGAIEYSSDVLLGLQLQGAGTKNFNETDAKKAAERKLELVILKNRNGEIGKNINYTYYPKYNLFKENK